MVLYPARVCIHSPLLFLKECLHMCASTCACVWVRNLGFIRWPIASAQEFPLSGSVAQKSTLQRRRSFQLVLRHISILVASGGEHKALVPGTAVSGYRTAKPFSLASVVHYPCGLWQINITLPSYKIKGLAPSSWPVARLGAANE